MELKLNVGLWVSLGTELGCTYSPEPRLVPSMKQPEVTRTLKQRKCYHENASLLHCKEEEGVLDSREKGSWPLSRTTISNARSPVLFLFLEKSSLHEKPRWDIGSTVIKDVMWDFACNASGWEHKTTPLLLTQGLQQLLLTSFCLLLTAALSPVVNEAGPVWQFSYSPMPGNGDYLQSSLTCCPVQNVPSITPRSL